GPVHLAATSIVVPFSSPPPSAAESPSSPPPHAAADERIIPAATAVPIRRLLNPAWPDRGVRGVVPPRAILPTLILHPPWANRRRPLLPRWTRRTRYRRSAGDRCRRGSSPGRRPSRGCAG